ncbi:unnamed protein product, partial [Allacma fusca]
SRRFWHHAYMYHLPRDIREWVDARMNCEDIAMNFLVSHHTGKAPVKVRPFSSVILTVLS